MHTPPDLRRGMGYAHADPRPQPVQTSKVKTFITTSLINISYYSLMAAMVFAVITGTDALFGVVAAAYWVIIVLGLFMGLLSLVIIICVDYSKDEKSRSEAIALLKRFAKRKNLLFRVWGFLCLIASTSLLAYGGWVFTAVAYVVTSLFVRLCCSLARDKIEKLSNVEAAGCPG